MYIHVDAHLNKITHITYIYNEYIYVCYTYIYHIQKKYIYVLYEYIYIYVKNTYMYYMNI